MNKDLIAQLISRSKVFESEKTSLAGQQESLSSLAVVTNSSFTPDFVPTKLSSPLMSGPRKQPKAQPTTFVTSRNEYQPALKQPGIAEALAQLQNLRSRNAQGAPSGPKILGTYRKPGN